MPDDALRFSPVVVTPTYNNAATLPGILRRVEATGLSIIVVNDGSTDATAALLTAWQAGPHPMPVRILTHTHNLGKAAALRTAFAHALEAGFTHALSIDTDGQLDPEQIPEFIGAAQAAPWALILGVRDAGKADYPTRSRLGRQISNFLVRLESGVRVSDSQCGLRVYPLDFVTGVPCRAGRFGFETEIISRAGWAGCAIVEVGANCRYLPPGQRVSHFRPWWDSVRSVGMHLRLLGRALLPLPHRAFHSRFAPTMAPPRRPLWQRLIGWTSPREAWQQARRDSTARAGLAAGVGVGVFIANLPVYPFQTALSIYAARRLHLHPLAVIAGSFASTPPLGMALIWAAISVGHLILHGALPHVALADMSHDHFREAVKYFWNTMLLDWWVGAAFVGFATSILAGLLTLVLCRPARTAKDMPAEQSIRPTAPARVRAAAGR